MAGNFSKYLEKCFLRKRYRFSVEKVKMLKGGKKWMKI